MVLPATKLYIDPEFFFLSWGGRAKPGPVFGPIGCHPGALFDWNWGQNIVMTPIEVKTGWKIKIIVTHTIVNEIQWNSNKPCLFFGKCNFLNKFLHLLRPYSSWKLLKLEFCVPMSKLCSISRFLNLAKISLKTSDWNKNNQ